jgi:hypothetical protein
MSLMLLQLLRLWRLSTKAATCTKSSAGKRRACNATATAPGVICPAFQPPRLPLLLLLLKLYIFPP